VLLLGERAPRAAVNFIVLRNQSLKREERYNKLYDMRDKKEKDTDKDLSLSLSLSLSLYIYMYIDR